MGAPLRGSNDRSALGPRQPAARRSKPSLPTDLGRPTCYRCFRPRVACICSLIHPVANRTRVLIVQHPRERKHPFGTARIARLGLSNVEVVLAEASDGEFRAPAQALQRAALLYPGDDAATLGEDPVSLDTLVVVDGTWPQSRKLVRVSPWLAALPRVALQPPRPANYRIRRAKLPAFEVSTIEAIAYALAHLEPDTPGVEGLVQTFDGVIDHQLGLQGCGDAPRFKSV